MNDTTLLYIVLFTTRCVIAAICMHKYGLKAVALMVLYAILTVMSPEVPI